MIKYYQGNLIHSTAPIIAHGCNCQGVMGAGVAKAIKNTFYHAYNQYKKAVDNRTFKLGKIQIIKCEQKYIANLATQKFFGRSPNVQYAQSEHIYICMGKLLDWASKQNIKLIAIPKIGCGLGGLTWHNDVLPVIQFLIKKYPSITIEVWTL